MRLDQELVRRGLCESRQEAQECIEKSFVTVQGVICTKRTKTVTEDTDIKVTSTRKFVSRGGEKLEGVIGTLFQSKDLSPKDFVGEAALDVGSSTGGFTDCLLSLGIASVVAVDVGTMQLHPRLRSDTRVLLFENTDIRKFEYSTPFDIIVADVSFTSLDKIIDTIISFGHKHSVFLLLIKPQFEVGFGNTKKGIVKDEKLVISILQKYRELLILKNVVPASIIPCSLQGGDGNQEYFIYGKLAN